MDGLLSRCNGQDEGPDYRRRYRGLIGVHSKVPIRDRAILSLVYTPGVAEAGLAIEEDPLASYDLTCRGVPARGRAVPRAGA